MAQRSSIEWTDSTWNPLTGCTKISPGCKNCYAEKMALRLQAMRNRNYAKGFSVATHEDVLDLPLKWKRPQTIFVNSMSDLFHENVDEDFIIRVFEVMRRADWHRYQILTKRSERLISMSSELVWMPHIWMGVSVEDNDHVFRIDQLRETGAKVKFLSIEPLLGEITDLNLKGIDWVIVGGESGPGSRPMRESWAVQIRNKCQERRVPFFFKQWGGGNRKKTGRQLEGRTWNQMPSMSLFDSCIQS